MTNSNDLTVEILKEIRGEIRQTNARLDGVREDLDTFREETSARFDELGRRIVESELRTATALTELAGTVRDMTTFLRSQADLRPRVEACEGDIAELKRKLAS